MKTEELKTVLTECQYFTFEGEFIFPANIVEFLDYVKCVDFIY